MPRDPKEPPKDKANRSAEPSLAEQRLARRKHRGAAEPADYANIDPLLLHRVITAVTSSHAAIQFGYTQDGGAFRIRIVAGKEISDEYVRPTEDVAGYFTSLEMDFGK